MQVILASQSPYRRAQLERFGIGFEAHSPKVDEDHLKKTGPADFKELTRFLAIAKAQSLKEKFPEALIIGSDQIAEFKGQRMDKPGTLDKAFQQLCQLSGNTHLLITSVAVIGPRGQQEVATEITEIRLRAMGEEFLKKYVQLDQPIDCAGAYKIERAGLSLIDSIKGQDPSAIEGLPLIGLTRCLATLGFSPAQLWRNK